MRVVEQAVGGDFGLGAARRPKPPQQQRVGGQMMKRKWKKVIWVGPLAVLLYLSAVGPYLWISGKTGWQNSETYIRITKPVFMPCLWLADHLKPYSRYVEWWVVLGCVLMGRNCSRQQRLATYCSPWRVRKR